MIETYFSRPVTSLKKTIRCRCFFVSFEKYIEHLWVIASERSRHRRCSIEKLFLKILQNSQENTCIEVSYLITCNFIKKENPTQVLSCEFCESFKNTFFTEHFCACASVLSHALKSKLILM